MTLKGYSDKSVIACIARARMYGIAGISAFGMDRAMQNVSGHMQAAKAQVSLRIQAV